MIAPVKLPPSALLAMNGAKLIDSVNTPDPTNGAVPYRNVGLPLALRTQYEVNEDSNFHRYARVDLIGTFDSVQSCTTALPAAEIALRLNPAPDVKVTKPVETDAESAFVTAKGVPIGWVTTQWDTTSRSIVNITGTLHFMRSGFVVRQVGTVARNMFVTTFGEGSNMMHLFAWANGTWGGGGFKDLDYLVSQGVSGEKGFQALPGTPPSGAQVTYWTRLREQNLQFQRALQDSLNRFPPI